MLVASNSGRENAGHVSFPGRQLLGIPPLGPFLRLALFARPVCGQSNFRACHILSFPH